MPKNPFKRGKPRHPYEDPYSNSNYSKRLMKIAIPAIVGVIIVAILIVSSVKFKNNTREVEIERWKGNGNSLHWL